MRFFDTNILLYSVSSAPAEHAKREVAIALLEADDAALSVQVLQEFYAQATRPTKSDPLSHADAVDMITGWSRFRIQDLSLAILWAALDIRARYRFSFWDCAIIAAARAQGCQELFTEDMRHGQIVDGVLIVDPFR